MGVVFSSVHLNAASTCLTTSGCAAAATSMGLQLGGNGYAFASNYSTKGCYYYPSGSSAGMAYFGDGGTEASMGTALSGSTARVDCPIANSHLGMPCDGSNPR